jgi:hypothetical protein
MGSELTITWLKNRKAPIERSTPPSTKAKKSLIGSRESITLFLPRNSLQGNEVVLA